MKDYAAYAAANAGVDESWKKPFGDEFKQADTHPVVKVNWNDAKAFCAVADEEGVGGREN